MNQAAKFRDGPSSEIHTIEGLALFLRELYALADTLHLPTPVKTRAGTIVTNAAAMRFCRVTSRAVLAAASLYVACRECKEPLTLRELADATGTDPRDVGRCYSNMLERMHISRPGLNGGGYVHRLALKRPLSDEIYKKSEEIVWKATQSGLAGRNPMTLAAAALYLACCSMGERVTQAEVSDAARVGEESVRECCKVIRASQCVAAT